MARKPAAVLELKPFEAFSDDEFEALLHRADWGALNFNEIRAELAWLREFAKQAAQIDAPEVPAEVYAVLNGARERIQRAVSSLNRFNVATASPSVERQNLVDLVKQITKETIRDAGPTLSIVTTMARNASYRKQIEEVRSQLLTSAVDVQHQINNAKGRLHEIIKEAETSAASARESASAAATAAQEDAARTGVSVHEGEFRNEVESLQQTRIAWLGAAAALGVSAIACAFFLGTEPLNDGQYILAVQRGITKIFVVGSLVTASVWCASNYRALSHQISVNRHRMNALRTFKTFVAAAETSEVRQAVLLETTRTIFGASPTGYLPANESNSETTSKSAEALLKAAKGSGA